MEADMDRFTMSFDKKFAAVAVIAFIGGFAVGHIWNDRFRTMRLDTNSFIVTDNLLGYHYWCHLTDIAQGRACRSVRK